MFRRRYCVQNILPKYVTNRSSSRRYRSPDADALPPARVRDPGLRGHVGEGAVTVVAEEVRSRFAPRRKTLQPRPVHKEDVEPPVVVVVVEGDAAASGFQQIFVLVLAAKNSLRVQSRFARYVEEAHAKSPPSPFASSFGSAAFCCAPARDQSGRAIASTLSSESTSAERLRDFRKTRREGTRGRYLAHSARARIRPYSLYSGNRDFASRAPKSPFVRRPQ